MGKQAFLNLDFSDASECVIIELQDPQRIPLSSAYLDNLQHEFGNMEM